MSPAKLRSDSPTSSDTEKYFGMVNFKVRDGDPLSTAVGYTWVPLLEKGSLATGRHELPVTSELPPSGGILNSKFNVEAISFFHFTERACPFKEVTFGAYQGPRRLTVIIGLVELKRAVSFIASVVEL